MPYSQRNSARPDPQPPYWADRLLAWFCPSPLLEELLGDLHEQFDQQVIEFGLSKARRLYVWEGIRYCRPYFISQRISADYKQFINQGQWFSISPVLIQNFLKIALRNIWKAKVFGLPHATQFRCYSSLIIGEMKVTG